MKKAIVTIMSLFVLSFGGSVHAYEELVWTPTHLLGSMVVGYTDFFVQEGGSETGVFSVVLEKDGTSNDLFDQLIVIGIPDSDRAMVIGIPSGAGGVAATPINVPGPADRSGRVSATPIVIPEPVINNFPSVAHIDHWSQADFNLEDVAMEFDPIPDPPPEGEEAWVIRDAGTGGLIAETPEPGGHPPGPNMFE
ncbi:MAG: hypothetical protein HQK65_11410 [Desulfamplus sp.]|nr:hypothetical protein [Desulfamplus sp.]